MTYLVPCRGNRPLIPDECAVDREKRNMWPFPQAEFEWKSPKNSRIAIERAIPRNRGRFWRTRIFIAFLLFLGYFSLFPFWLDQFLPPGSRSQRSQGQIDRLPSFMAINGCLAFAMVFGPSWFRKQWAERIRLNEDKVTFVASWHFESESSGG